MLSLMSAFRELLNLAVVFKVILDSNSKVFVVIWTVGDGVCVCEAVERAREWMNVYRIWELCSFGRLGATVAETNSRGELEILVD